MSNGGSIFSGIYQTNAWGDRQSASGPGSNLRQTELVSRELPRLLTALGVRRFLDGACGDMNWMRRLDYEFTHFHGIDVVPELVAKLRAQIWADNYGFTCADITKDPLPTADAILCRDVLVHLPYKMIHDFVANLKRSGIPYLLTTTFPEKIKKDIFVGQWRALNLEDAPFEWPSPRHIIREREQNPEDPYNDKSLGVWRVEDIPQRG